MQSPIYRAMLPVYADARDAKYKGKVTNRNRDFQKAIVEHGKGVFMKSYDFLRHDIYKALIDRGEELKVKLEALFVEILTQFNLMCTESQMEDEQEAAFRELLKENLGLVNNLYRDKLRPKADAFFGGGVMK